MNRRALYIVVVLLIVVGAVAASLQASFVYPLEIFTDNGTFCNSVNIDIFFEVSEAGDDFIDFVFHNESLVESSIARIYFDSDLPLSLAAVAAGAGVDFGQYANPKNLPAGNELEPVFLASDGLSFESAPPRPHSGVNPGQWLRITMDTAGQISFEEIIEALNCGDVRIGTHIIALPDGSSEAATNIPEPVTISLLAIGALAFLRKGKSEPNAKNSKSS